MPTSVAPKQLPTEDVADEDIMEVTEAEATRVNPEHLQLKHIAGLEKAKQILLEAIILPRKFPYLYSTLKPWNKIFLYGVSAL